MNGIYLEKSQILNTCYMSQQPLRLLNRKAGSYGNHHSKKCIYAYSNNSFHSYRNYFSSVWNSKEKIRIFCRILFPWIIIFNIRCLIHVC